MSHCHGRGHSALRRGRSSASGAEYFLTLCTKDRAAGLADSPLATLVLGHAHRLSREGHWHLHSAVVMPDHVHLLISLGPSAGLAFVVRLFKGRLTPILRRCTLQWERGYFDRRLRADDDRTPVFLYLLLNPYRRGLIDANQRWSAYYCASDDWEWFESLTAAACPFPDWLR